MSLYPDVDIHPVIGPPSGLSSTAGTGLPAKVWLAAAATHWSQAFQESGKPAVAIRRL